MTATSPAQSPAPPNEPQRPASLSGSMSGLPQDVRILLRQIQQLPSQDLLAIVESATREANKAVFSVSDYRSKTWLVPNVEEVPADQPQWGVSCDVPRGLLLSFTTWGKRFQISISGLLLRLGVIFLVYLCLWTILPQEIIEDGGVVFDPLVTVVMSAVVGGFFARLLQIPPLIGVMWIAIMWNNVPVAKRYTSGIVSDVRTISSRIGLTLILCRAGFALSLPALRPVLANTIALAVLPYACESVVHAALARHLFFEGNWTWSFLEGLLCSIVSAAIIIPGVLLLREQGYGLVGGPLTLALTSVGLDTVLGIWATNFVIGLQFDNSSLGFQLGMIPVQILGGAIVGVVLGVLFRLILELLRREVPRMPNGQMSKDHVKSTNKLIIIIFLAVVLSAVFIGSRIALPGGGAVVALAFAATVSNLLTKDNDAELKATQADLGANLASVWDSIVMPLIFSMLGSNIVLSEVFNREFFPYGFAVVVTSCTTRCMVAMLCTAGMTMKLSQRALLGLAWLGRAGSQAALGGVPLTLALSQLRAAPVGTDLTALQTAVRYGTIVKNVSVLYIIFCALIAALSIVKLGPHMLQRFDTTTGQPIKSPRTADATALDGEVPAPVVVTLPDERTAPDGAGSHEPAAAP